MMMIPAPVSCIDSWPTIYFSTETSCFILYDIIPKVGYPSQKPYNWIFYKNMPFYPMAAIAITSQHQKVPYGSLADPHPRLGQERPSLDSLNSAMSGNLVMDSPPHHGTEPGRMTAASGGGSRRRGTGDDALRIRAGCPGAFGKDVIMARGFGMVGDCTQKCPGIYPMMISPFKLFIDWGLACFGDKPTTQTGHCTTCHFVTHDWESIC